MTYLLQKWTSEQNQISNVYLIWVYIPVERHHNHGKSYKEKHFIGACLQFRALVNYHHARKEVWWNAGRHAIREVAENSTSRLVGSKKRE